MFANPPRLREVYEDVPLDDPSGDEPADKLDICARVCTDLINEGKLICRQRRAQAPEAILAIWRELEQKWAAIVRRVGDPVVTVETFQLVLRALEKSDEEST